MSNVAPETGDFGAGRVIGRSLDLLADNFRKFYALAALVSAPLLLLSLCGVHDGSNTACELDLLCEADLLVVPLGIGRALFELASIFGYGPLSLGLSMACQAATAPSVIQAMHRRGVAIGPSLRHSFARALPVLALIALIGLTLAGVGLLLPLALLTMTALVERIETSIMAIGALNLAGGLGIAAAVSYVLTAWFVALPLCVVERLGPLRSLRRSAQLTRRCRWKIFGIYLLVSLMRYLVQGVLVAMLPPIVGRYGTAVGGYLWASLIAAFEAVVVAVAYLELRAAKEGIDAERVAAVFD